MYNKLKTIDAETLLATPMSKTMFIVDKLIPQGVSVVSGASKIGKSWLMLWLSLQVAQGLSVWDFKVQHCDVLYLCLEDTQRRIKDRLYKLTDTAPSNLRFAIVCNLLGNGLENQITAHLGEYPNTKLIIIDTLQKVRDSKGSGLQRFGTPKVQAVNRECTQVIMRIYLPLNALRMNTTLQFYWCIIFASFRTAVTPLMKFPV